MVLFHTQKMQAVAIAAAMMGALATSHTVFAASSGTVLQYTASGTFGSVIGSGLDKLKLAGTPYSLSIFVKESRTPTATGTTPQPHAIYSPLDLTGSVQPNLPGITMPISIKAYSSMILVQASSGPDQIQVYAPVTIKKGTIDIHGALYLPAGTLTSLAIAPLSSTPALPAESTFTYSNSTGSTTLQVHGKVSATVYTPPSAVSATLYTNGAEVITGHADGTQTVRSLAAAPVDLRTSDTVMLRFYASGVSSAAEVHVQLAGQDVPVRYAGPSGHFAGLDEIMVVVPHSLAGIGEADAVLTVDGQTADPAHIHIQ